MNPDPGICCNQYQLIVPYFELGSCIKVKNAAFYSEPIKSSKVSLKCTDQIWEMFAFEGTMPLNCLLVIENREKLAGKHRKQNSFAYLSQHRSLAEIRILKCSTPVRQNADLLWAICSPCSPMTRLEKLVVVMQPLQ
jgi:hypothetical protein